MPRSMKQKMVNHPPLYSSFKPTGVAKRKIQSISLDLDEYEAIRLADYLGMEHTEAAEEMEISRSTFTRLIERARKKAAKLLIEGKELVIQGGNIHFRGNIYRCHDCDHMFNINFKTRISTCPDCDSSNLLNLAGGFGHGACCLEKSS